MWFTRILNLENFIHLLKIQAVSFYFFLHSFYNKNQSHNQITDYQELLQELLFFLLFFFFFCRGFTGTQNINLVGFSMRDSPVPGVTVKGV